MTIRKFYLLKLFWDEKISYLYRTGWIRSFKTKRPVCIDGHPIPWLTLPFIHFLDNRLYAGLDVFEFGSGNSTKYFKRKKCHVTSVDVNKEWIYGDIIFAEKKEDYLASIKHQNKKYDLILVDGSWRDECILEAPNFLKEKGVIVCDNTFSDLKSYKSSLVFLTKEKGFKRLDFYGIAPGSIVYDATTVFYKPANCLDI